MEWVWSREIDLGASMIGWRQRVVLSSECGQLTLVAVDVLADAETGVRKVLIQSDDQPPLRLHNLTPHDLYVSEVVLGGGEEEVQEAAPSVSLHPAQAAQGAQPPLRPQPPPKASQPLPFRLRPGETPLKLAAGAHGPYCCTSILDERLSSHAQLSRARGSAADAGCVSKLTAAPRRRPHLCPLTAACSCSTAVAAVAAAAAVAAVAVMATSGGSLRRRQYPSARAAICQQGPTCLVVFPQDPPNIPRTCRSRLGVISRSQRPRASAAATAAAAAAASASPSQLRGSPSCSGTIARRQRREQRRPRRGSSGAAAATTTLDARRLGGALRVDRCSLRRCPRASGWHAAAAIARASSSASARAASSSTAGLCARPSRPPRSS